MAWTADGLLLVCIIKRGSLLILPCMGRPLQLVTSGCSLDMGPAVLLPLHPRISYVYVNYLTHVVNLMCSPVQSICAYIYVL